MIVGSAGMAICHIIIGIIVATCQDNWAKHAAAGWVAVGELYDLNVRDNALTPSSFRMAVRDKLFL